MANPPSKHWPHEWNDWPSNFRLWTTSEHLTEKYTMENFKKEIKKKKYLQTEAMKASYKQRKQKAVAVCASQILWKSALSLSKAGK